MERKKGDTSQTCGSVEDSRRKLVEDFLAVVRFNYTMPGIKTRRGNVAMSNGIFAMLSGATNFFWSFSPFLGSITITLLDARPCYGGGIRPSASGHPANSYTSWRKLG